MKFKIKNNWFQCPKCGSDNVDCIMGINYTAPSERSDFENNLSLKEKLDELADILSNSIAGSGWTTNDTHCQLECCNCDYWETNLHTYLILNEFEKETKRVKK